MARTSVYRSLCLPRQFPCLVRVLGARRSSTRLRTILLRPRHASCCPRLHQRSRHDSTRGHGIRSQPRRRLAPRLETPMLVHPTLICHPPSFASATLSSDPVHLSTATHPPSLFIFSWGTGLHSFITARLVALLCFIYNHSEDIFRALPVPSCAQYSDRIAAVAS